ncbi:baeyer-Villiger monooxygenase isoform X3 [Hydra vulgaris]|uniref:Flavin-containing monooxygenase n=1 Tax=Hydra vulgaris TaxID=6087 RepID=A0ABM4BS16_HYDVU
MEIFFERFEQVFVSCLLIALMLIYGSLWYILFGITIYLFESLYSKESISQEVLKKRNNTFVVIIGAGFSGICAAIKLKKENIKFIIFEAAPDLGGTWLHNVYPGCACDVVAHLYSFSFYPNQNWKTQFASQSEILQYLKSVCDFYDIRQYMRFNTAVQNCYFDSKTQQWKVTTSENEEFMCNFVISGAGVLHVPKIPVLKGFDLFKGESFHSAKWNKECSLEGKLVAVIGTGASAVQIVPSIADRVKNLYVFQRTPAWSSLPSFLKQSPLYPRGAQTVFKIFPTIFKLYRWLTFFRYELNFYLIFRNKSFLTKLIQKSMTKAIQDQLQNESLKKKMVPSYDIGCKRITPSNNFLQTFNKKNVHLVTEPIISLTEDGIKTDENEYKIDILIYATGFDVAASITSLNIIGPDGVTLNEKWGNKPNAYLGIMCPGFPNLFYLLGPNTALGHNSVVWMIECQMNFVMDAILKCTDNGLKSLEVLSEVNDKFQCYVMSESKKRPFSRSCGSWYLNKDGENFTLWPSHLLNYWWRTLSVDLKEFKVQ